jgi:hypothetical protein
MRIRGCIAVALVLGTILSCGYRFAGVGKLPAGIQSIYVGVLENPTAETGIEIILSNDIVYEFTRAGHPVVRTPSKADATLTGRIARLDIQTVSHKGAQQTQEERVTIVLSLRLIDSDNTILWAGNTLSENQTYEVESGNKKAVELNRRSAIESLSKRLAQNVYNRLVAGF